jgi:thiosulfate/3-mercaptopyruvate sulfurtransferase
MDKNMLIGAKALLEAQRRGDPVLIMDCRHDLMNPQAGPQAYTNGHLPGARLVDFEHQLSGPKTGKNGRHPLPNAHAFQAMLQAAGLTAQTLLIAYDDNGGQFAARLWWLARWIGHNQVSVLDGGVRAWTAAGGALETGQTSPLQVPHVEAQSATTLAMQMPTVSASDVLANISSRKQLVLDARAAPRFRGEVEPIDPVAGHIPNAMNRPCSMNLAEDGRFKPADQLREEFSLMLAQRPADSIIHQCGSGVTACHNLLAMEIAGLSGSSLFPGSWSEWISDASRPINTKHL